MALIEWNDHLYSVKIDQFDADNKRIVLFINDLHTAMLTGKGREKLGTLLNDLLTYTQSHFSSEEKEMEAVGYPELDTHKRLHRDLIIQLTNLN